MEVAVYPPSGHTGCEIVVVTDATGGHGYAVEAFTNYNTVSAYGPIGAPRPWQLNGQQNAVVANLIQTAGLPNFNARMLLCRNCGSPGQGGLLKPDGESFTVTIKPAALPGLPSGFRHEATQAILHSPDVAGSGLQNVAIMGPVRFAPSVKPTWVTLSFAPTAPPSVVDLGSAEVILQLTTGAGSFVILGRASSAA